MGCGNINSVEKKKEKKKKEKKKKIGEKGRSEKHIIEEEEDEFFDYKSETRLCVICYQIISKKEKKCPYCQRPVKHMKKSKVRDIKDSPLIHMIWVWGTIDLKKVQHWVDYFSNTEVVVILWVDQNALDKTDLKYLSMGITEKSKFKGKNVKTEEDIEEESEAENENTIEVIEKSKNESEKKEKKKKSKLETQTVIIKGRSYTMSMRGPNFFIAKLEDNDFMAPREEEDEDGEGEEEEEESKVLLLPKLKYPKTIMYSGDEMLELNQNVGKDDCLSLPRAITMLAQGYPTCVVASDILRVLILYRMGGIYFDFDVTLNSKKRPRRFIVVKAIKKIVASKKLILRERENDFMASAPFAEPLKKLVRIYQGFAKQFIGEAKNITSINNAYGRLNNAIAQLKVEYKLPKKHVKSLYPTIESAKKWALNPIKIRSSVGNIKYPSGFLKYIGMMREFTDMTYQPVIEGEIVGPIINVVKGMLDKSLFDKKTNEKLLFSWLSPKLYALAAVEFEDGKMEVTITELRSPSDVRDEVYERL